jgi:DNA topoisomerase-2
MAIYSLTTEKVHSLLDQKAKKEVELNKMLQLTAKDLWTLDLDELSAAWQGLLDTDNKENHEDLSKTKKGRSSKFTKVSKKRASDAADGGEYMERKPKVAKTSATSAPKQAKITSFASTTTTSAPKGTKGMHTAAFTSVNTGSIKTEDITKVKPVISIADDDEFESLIKGIRADDTPKTIDLVSPSTAVRPKKTFVVPGTRKTSALAVPKPRATSKSKALKRKIDSDDEDESFAFMADDKPVSTDGGGRRPARQAATKARAIVLTSDDVFDELDDEDDFDEGEDSE